MSEDFLAEPPFPCTAQLIDSLQYTPKEQILRRTDVTGRGKGPNYQRLPGSPHIELLDTSAIFRHCADNFTTKQFDQLAKKNRFTLGLHTDPISTLTENGARVRKIVVSENPKLHMIWDDDRVFVKPIPAYLCSHDFWIFLLSGYSTKDYTEEDRKDIIASTSGFLRSYAQLITYESDYHIAQSLHLIPATASFEDLIIFLSYFKHLPDALVSYRHRFGIMQLQTLNWTSFLSSAKPYYRLHQNRYNSFFQQYYGPCLFVFATFSVALSAMQVTLAVRAGEAPVEGVKDGGLGGDWARMGYAFRWFSIWSMCFAGSMAMFLAGLLFSLIGMDTWEGWARWRRGGKSRTER